MTGTLQILVVNLYYNIRSMDAIQALAAVFNWILF